ncbi:lipoprotein [Comamonas testosteroni]|uniref:Lipoprotein n=1 Tax=Comamonas testosteroni TaxID=285 RepID=A0A5A7MJH8_COMTE|nr:putative holin [Comamonas testosteroni]GEQ77051.1 lipoprotein [Comamonas testosteroni]
MPSTSAQSLRQSKLPRMTSWWLIALALSALVFVISPQQIPTSIFKLNLIALASVAGYWIDRKVFPYARPNLDALRLLSHPGTAAPAEFSSDPATPGESCMLVSWPDAAPLYFMLGCMLRRALIMSAAILAVSLGG